jgi:hypothetical protein
MLIGGYFPQHHREGVNVINDTSASLLALYNELELPKQKEHSCLLNPINNIQSKNSIW